MAWRVAATLLQELATSPRDLECAGKAKNLGKCLFEAVRLAAFIGTLVGRLGGWELVMVVDGFDVEQLNKRSKTGKTRERVGLDGDQQGDL